MTRGKTFHRYRIARRIARGGMAEVFLALLRGPFGFEKRVALKKILPMYGNMEEFAVLFRDEARLSALLEHSNIVQTYEFGRYEGEYFMAMEYVDGPDLEELLDRCRRRGILLPIEVVLHVAHELTRALEYSHSLKDDDGQPMAIIHRDVSPPNVLIDVHGAIKLTDFGVAKAAHREAETRPGVLRGKYAYMSPEQVRQVDIDHRSDIFSIGIVLYEALTGVNPFEGASDFQTMEAVKKAKIEPATFLRPDTPTELDRVLLACLEPDPNLRYQNAGDLRRDLSKVMRSLPIDDGARQLVNFLRDVFPERAPGARPTLVTDTGAPSWDYLAHRLTAMTLPIPVVDRTQLANTLATANANGRLVMDFNGLADSKSQTSNATPVEMPPSDNEPQAQGDAAADRELHTPVALGHSNANSNNSTPEGNALFEEWVEEQKEPDRIHTQPGLWMRSYDDSELLGPMSAAPSKAPVPPWEFPDGVGERTKDGIPIFNEWEEVNEGSGSLSAVSFSTGQGGASAAHPEDSQHALQRPHPPSVRRSRPTRLRPPGRPRLHPTSRARLEPFQRPLDVQSTRQPVAGDVPTSHKVKPSIEPVGSTSTPAEAPPGSVPESASRPTRRSGWVNLAWVAVAVLVPLASLATLDWVESLQRSSQTPKITAPGNREGLQSVPTKGRDHSTPTTPLNRHPGTSQNDSTAPSDEASPRTDRPQEN